MVKFNFFLILVFLLFSGCKDKKTVTPVKKGNIAEQTVKKSVPELTPAPEKPEQKLTTEQIAESRNSFDYHIVAASYNNITQANLFKNRLYKKGYPSLVLEQKGKFRVIMQSFNKKETALKELIRLRKLNKVPDLWLLHQ
ncbi:MAG: SPOR domain-containing protein [Labilibaculum antarcticum]